MGLVTADRAQASSTDRQESVDTTLIDAMLDLTAEERLRQNDRMLRMIEGLRHGIAAGEDRSHHADR
jgi:hypothetical protein